MDAVSHGFTFLRRCSRAALRRNARPYGYAGVVALPHSARRLRSLAFLGSSFAVYMTQYQLLSYQRPRGAQ